MLLKILLHQLEIKAIGIIIILNPKDPVALNLFSQKDLVEALEKAERRIKREKKEKEKAKQSKEISNIE